ncbi:hypothetical protein [Staphylococcus pseudoxylosus]
MKNYNSNRIQQKLNYLSPCKIQRISSLKPLCFY